MFLSFPPEIQGESGYAPEHNQRHITYRHVSAAKLYRHFVCFAGDAVLCSNFLFFLNKNRVTSS